MTLSERPSTRNLRERGSRVGIASSTFSPPISTSDLQSSSSTDSMHRLKVRDFAYEPSLLPPVRTVPRPADPLTVVMRRALKRAREPSPGDACEPKKLKMVQRTKTHSVLLPDAADSTSSDYSLCNPQRSISLRTQALDPSLGSQSKLDDQPPTPVIIYAPSPQPPLFNTRPRHRRSSSVSSLHFSILNGFGEDSISAIAVPSDDFSIGSDSLPLLSSTTDLRPLVIRSTSSRKVGRSQSGLIPTPT